MITPMYSSRQNYHSFSKAARQIDIKGKGTLFEYDFFCQLKGTIATDSIFTEKEYDTDGNTFASIEEFIPGLMTTDLKQ
ncbi:MAG TPA: hypothetical protein VKO63_03490 [Chitinispirillaceae bacterium]|nr:hypothetical protein [Chitinispirillaceae bacterium]